MDIPAVLGNWAGRDGPLYRQLAAALRAAIERGELPPELRLPPERQLARSLAVSRSTVVAAYEQLKRDGWLDSRQGSGTWVRRVRRPANGLDSGDQGPRLGAMPVFRGLLDRPAGAIDFSAAAVPADPSISEAIDALHAADLACEPEAPHGYAPAGVRSLRRALAARFRAAGLPTGEEQILVTTGAQQAIALLGLYALRAGDTVLVETATYPGALEAFRAVGARLQPVPIDGAGVRRDSFEELVARTSPRLAYLVPNFHNPTGVVLSAGRRAEIARLAASSRLLVIDDDTLGDLSFDGDTAVPPLLASYPNDGFVVTVGSMSKLWWGGLRIGWIRASQPLVTRLARLKGAMDLGSPMSDQVLALALLDRAQDVRRRRREQLVTQLDALTGALTEHLPSWQWRRPDGGLSLWVRLPGGRAQELAQVALRHGVNVVPGSVFSPEEGLADSLRLPFVLPADVLTEGVRRLARAWQAYEPSVDRGRVPMDVVI